MTATTQIADRAVRAACDAVPRDHTCAAAVFVRAPDGSGALGQFIVRAVDEVPPQVNLACAFLHGAYSCARAHAGDDPTQTSRIFDEWIVLYKEFMRTVGPLPENRQIWGVS